MQLKITVKTLDSQNYQFEAEQDWTVLRFKEHIQDTVNVPSTEQRLIFCGRVLQNEKKLTEYDCNGKVIHLVRRPPPINEEASNNNAGQSSDNNNSFNESNRQNDVFTARIDGNVRGFDDANVFIRATGLGNHVARTLSLIQQFISNPRLFTHDGRYIGPIEASFVTGGIPFVAGSPMDTSTITTQSNLTSDSRPSGVTDATAQLLLFEMDGRLNNAYRMLTITATLLLECRARLPRSSRLAASRPRRRPPTATAERESSDQSMTDEDSQERHVRASGISLDDLSIGTTTREPVIGETTTTSTRQRRPSFTTDDLPQTENRRPLDFESLARVQQTRQVNEATLLERYFSILDAFLDLQDQYRDLLRLHRRAMDLSRRGNFGAFQNPPVISETSNTTDSSSRDSTDNLTSRPHSSSSLSMAEARILGPYVPRIVHHMSHLQHALSDFSYDFIRGRLRLASNRGGFSRPQFAIRSNPPVYQSPSRQPQQQAPHTQTQTSWSTGSQPIVRSEDQPTIESSVTITASSPSSSAPANPRASAALVITSEPGQANIHIPISISPSMGRDSITIESFTTSPFIGTLNSSAQDQNRTPPDGPQSQPTPNQQTAQPAGQGSAPDEQSRPTSDSRCPFHRATRTTNSTQTPQTPAHNIIGFSTRLPFDPFLTCRSPWAHWSTSERTHIVDSSAIPASMFVPTTVNIPSNIQFQTQASPRPQQTASSQTAESRANLLHTPGQNQPGAAPAGLPNVVTTGLTEVVSNILRSILHPPGQPGEPIQQQQQHLHQQHQQQQQQQQQASQPQQNQRPQHQQQQGGPAQNRDPIVDILPELAINAASQILETVFGTGPVNSRNQAGQHQSGQRQPTTRTVMMDIDIDEGTPATSTGTSSAHSPRTQTTPNAPQQSSRGTQQSSYTRQTGRDPSHGMPSTSSSSRHDRNYLASMLQSHPDWIPIIEADIDLMERANRSGNNNIQAFSDAYLSSLPRKRRRLISATPDRVPILQPSSSQALTNLLRRAITGTDSMSHDPRDIEEILRAITSDPDLQAAYDEYIKCAVEARLQSDCNYRPEKFENSSKYFKK